MNLQKQKKRTNFKTKNAQNMKRARKGMLGFTITWADTNPFSENGEIIFNGNAADHPNPTQKLICKDMWQRCSNWILNTEFTWTVLMRVVFENTKRGDKYDDFYFTYSCTLRGNKSDILNDAMEAELKESLRLNDLLDDENKNKGIYSRCEFMAQIIGS